MTQLVPLNVRFSADLEFGWPVHAANQLPLGQTRLWKDAASAVTGQTTL